MYQNWHIHVFIKKLVTKLQHKKHHVQNEWETWAENDIFVARHMSQSKIIEIPLVFKLLLAVEKTHVRQTIGISVRKRALQHQEIQVKNRTSRIELPLGKKGGTNSNQPKSIRPVTKNGVRSAAREV